MMDDPKNNTLLNRFKRGGQMLAQFLFEPPATIAEPDVRLRARIIAVLLLIMGLGFALGAVATFTLGSRIGIMPLEFYLSMTAVLMLIGYGLSRTRNFVWGAIVALVPLLLPAYMLLFSPPVELTTLNSTYMWLVLPILIGSVFFTRRGYVILVSFAIIAPILLPLAVPAYSYAQLGQIIGYLLLLSVLVGAIVRFQEWIEALRRQTVEGIMDELQGANALLERRARIVETSYEINKKLANILDPKKLVDEVVNQIQTEFHYNYVQLYLLDEAGKNLVVAAGTGEAGRALYSQKHQIPVGKGLVGQAAATREYVLVDDVDQMGTWISNPLLPNTKSELVVPIAIGETVLGVLDVQHNEKAALTVEDVSLLQSVASAVAIAFQNANVYRQIQQKAERESVVNQINQRLLSAPTMERILHITAEELGQALGIRRATIQLSRTNNGNGRSQEKADAS